MFCGPNRIGTGVCLACLSDVFFVVVVLSHVAGISSLSAAAMLLHCWIERYYKPLTESLG